MAFKKIDVTEIEGFHLGNAEDAAAGTGCTVIICEDGAVAGVDVRGGGPATRETDLLRSENTVQAINAVMISGGSAFGLEAGSGAMRYLEEKRIGFDTSCGIVPIVCQASLYDLGVGKPDVRPDVRMGRAACENAYTGTFISGNHGAGTGASVGKYYGMERAMKTGLGTFACSDGVVKVGAVTAVNAMADVYNGAGNIIAGLRSEDGNWIRGTVHVMKDDVRKSAAPAGPKEPELTNPFPKKELSKSDMGYDVSFNTTISCLITNAKLTKPQCNKLASILHDGLARAVKPVHSSLDGDTIFVMSTNKVDVNFDSFGALATDILQYSIIDGALSAEDAYGLPCARTMRLIAKSSRKRAPKDTATEE